MNCLVLADFSIPDQAGDLSCVVPRSGLSCVANWDARTRQLTFRQSCYGKPYAMLDDKPITTSFNISHSGKHGLIAFSPHGRLGVDVEERVARKDIDDLSKMVFGPNERSALALVSGWRKIDLFFKFWTIKEALIKAVGMGFSLDPSSFEIPTSMYSGTTSTFQFPQKPAPDWQMEYIGNEEFAAAVAYEAIAPPSTEQLTASSELQMARKSGV